MNTRRDIATNIERNDYKNGEFLVSIITVCFNAEQTIEKTMCSVLNQTYRNIDYIIKDGNSTDRTNEIVESYDNKFKRKGIRFRHIIQKDQGIYDAMNQATDIADGVYINYMNSDDIFFDNHVLQNIFGKNKPVADVLYGDAICEYEFVKKRKEYTLWKGQHSSMAATPFCHQACFFRTSLIRQYHYDTRFCIASDYHLISRYYIDGKSFSNVNCIVAVDTMNGISHNAIKKSYMETAQIRRELQMKEYMSQDTLLNMWLIRIKQWIVKVLPYRLVGPLLRAQVQRKSGHIYKSLEAIISDNVTEN